MGFARKLHLPHRRGYTISPLIPLLTNLTGFVLKFVQVRLGNRICTSLKLKFAVCMQHTIFVDGLALTIIPRNKEKFLIRFNQWSRMYRYLDARSRFPSHNIGAATLESFWNREVVRFLILTVKVLFRNSVQLLGVALHGKEEDYTLLDWFSFSYCMQPPSGVMR